MGLLTSYAGPEGNEVRMTGRGVPGVVAVLIGTLMASSCGSAGDVAVAAPGPAESEVPGPAASPAPISAPAGKGTILGNVVRGWA